MTERLLIYAVIKGRLCIPPLSIDYLTSDNYLSRGTSNGEKEF